MKDTEFKELMHAGFLVMKPGEEHMAHSQAMITAPEKLLLTQLCVL